MTRSRRCSHWVPVTPLVLIVIGGLACNDLSGLAGKQPLPAGTPNPSTYSTPAGAIALYNATVTAFQQSDQQDTSTGGYISGGEQDGGVVDFLLTSGLLTDELQAGNAGQTLVAGSTWNSLDARQLPIGGASTGSGNADELYTELQGIRNTANIAIRYLAAYDSSASPAFRGQLYALQGYSIIFLADLYCSGVPLSTIDFNGDFTYHTGSSTSQLYQAAISEFDTAIVLSADSTRILNLAHVGKGRAFLDLGQYDSAAAAVEDVPEGFSYQFPVDWTGGTTNPGGLFSNAFQSTGVTVADREGGNGLPYISSADPRTATGSWGNNVYRVPQFAPTKYGGSSPGIYPVTVADWIEARLIQAEAAYNHVATGQGSWLDQLNALRQTVALSPLSDPGTDSARVALLFQERAYWLFLTGHREGDLRRLLRNYSQWFDSPDAVYPTGPYLFGGQLSTYGEDINAPVPQTEQANYLFTGCLSRGA